MTGALVLLLLSAPIWLLAAIFILLDSPGPVLFAHDRIGRQGRRFRLLKFRTMWCGAEPYALSPRTGADARVTPVGRVLRPLGFDEFPQLINVLRGEMSLVGPRPEMPFIADQYSPRERERLAVRPGLTGAWQISTHRNAAIHENLSYDLDYIARQSLTLDAMILLKTVRYTTSACIRALQRAVGRAARLRGSGLDVTPGAPGESAGRCGARGER